MQQIKATNRSINQEQIETKIIRMYKQVQQQEYQSAYR